MPTRGLPTSSVGVAGPGVEGRCRQVMSVLARLALLFVIVPLLELALLIEIGQLVGFLPTMGLER